MPDITFKNFLTLVFVVPFKWLLISICLVCSLIEDVLSEIKCKLGEVCYKLPTVRNTKKEKEIAEAKERKRLELLEKLSTPVDWENVQGLAVKKVVCKFENINNTEGETKYD